MCLPKENLEHFTIHQRLVRTTLGNTGNTLYMYVYKKKENWTKMFLRQLIC